MLQMFPFQASRFAWAAAALLLAGCTSPREYIQNGYKVGPNYCRPQAQVAEHWIDPADHHVRKETADLSHWWTVFRDPVLDRFIADAYGQNLTLREAGMRVLAARSQVGIATGRVFPQQQDAFGSYRRQAAGGEFFDQWTGGFSLAWELDFWGRFRRAVEAADAALDASVEDYDNVLVTLLGDVAANYVQVRTSQERINLLDESVKVQRVVLAVAKEKFNAETINELDVDQATSNLRQSEAAMHQLKIDLRLAENRLCILLSIPPEDLRERLGEHRLPDTPTEVAAGIPADLLRRRPDVRRAERLAAAQGEEIGIAQADLYPAFSIAGTLGYQSRNLRDLFASRAFTGSVGPSFQWNLLNYGRIVNNVRLQEARFQELVLAYQDTVLQANAEVENGLTTFRQSHDRAVLLEESVQAAKRAVLVLVSQYEIGNADFARYAVIEQNLIQQQDQWAQARGQIALGLIQVYRALGGGWEIRLEPEERLYTDANAPPTAAAAPEAPFAPEEDASPAGNIPPLPPPLTPK
jgi:NodT family efflux transporter outer membrane factor (OMF) lipoprotein